MAGWDGQWDGPRNLRFSCLGTQADSGLLQQVCGTPVSCPHLCYMLEASGPARGKPLRG